MRLLLICLMSWIITGEGKKNASTTNSDFMNYQIEITRLIFGRPATITRISADSLEVELYNNGPKHPPNLESRKLKLEEKAMISDVLETFPLEKMERSYVHGGVKDGSEFRFSIKKGDLEKKIFVGNYYQEDLGRLVLEVTKLLPKDYIHYSRAQIPYPVD